MKAKQLNYKLYLAVIFLLTSLAMTGQNYEKSRSVREGFKIGKNVEVQVINKYGDINMIPWDKDSVVFEIEMKITSNKQAKVDKIFDYIDFDFRTTAYYVIAQTVFEGQNTFWTEMSDMASTIFSGSTNTRIDYTVYYPANNDIKLENKFGNIYTTDHTGKVDITLSNGDMKAHAFRGPTRLQLDFCNASIDEIVDATLTLGYVEMNLEKAGDLRIESRSTKMYFTDCNRVNLNSKRDRIYIKKAGEITGDMFFTYLSVDEAISKINLMTNYGDIKILGVAPTFSRMDFSSQNSDVTLYIDQNHLFDMDITRDEKSSVVSSIDVISKSEAPVEGQDKIYKAVITAGKQGKPKIILTLNLKSGKLYLMRS